MCLKKMAKRRRGGNGNVAFAAVDWCNPALASPSESV
jgi:hypothetical protein